MRKTVAAIALISFGAVLTGLIVPLAVRENRVVANHRDAQPVARRTPHTQPSITTTPGLTSLQIAQLEANPPPASAPKSQANRFDRGRLSEEYDGELPSKITDAPFVEAEEAPEELVLNDQDPFGSVITPPKETPSPKRPAQLVEDTEYIQPAPAPTWENPASKEKRPQQVTLIVSSDQQIHVSPSNKTDLKAAITDGTLVITADEFTLTPARETGAGNQIVCNGNVQIHHQHFAGQGTQLTVDKSALVLQGTAERPAMINKFVQAAPAAGTIPGNEFRLTARKILFTSSLDKLQVENGALISPAPALEANPQPNAVPPAPPVTSAPRNSTDLDDPELTTPVPQAPSPPKGA